MPGWIRLWNSSLLFIHLITNLYKYYIVFNFTEWEFSDTSTCWCYHALRTAPLLPLAIFCTTLQNCSAFFYNLVLLQHWLHSIFPLESTVWHPKNFFFFFNLIQWNAMSLSSHFLIISGLSYAYFKKNKFCTRMRAVSHLPWHEITY